MSPRKQTRRKVLAATGAATLTSLTGCIGDIIDGSHRVYNQDAPFGDVTGAWPTYQHDFANTGFTTDSGPSSDATLSRVVELDNAAFGTAVTLIDGRGIVGYSGGSSEDGEYRSFTLDSSSGSWTVDYKLGKSTPTIAGNAVFVSTAEFVAAYDVRNGKLCWRADDGGSGVAENAPILAEGTLLDYTTSTVNGRDPATGEKRWQYGVGDSLVPPVTRDGTAYTATETGAAAFDPKSGEEVWRQADLPESSAPLAVGDNHLYYSAKGEDLYALSLDDGASQWQASIPLSERGSHYTAISDGTLHVQSADGVVAAFDAVDGSKKYIKQLEADLRQRPPVVADDTRFSLGDETLYAFDVETGDIQWSLPLDTEPVSGGVPSIRGEELYFVSNSHLLRVSN
ncbi:PQQ-binding-like beta-propeller repeat protein [Halogeometricum borinquense]|uniref:PQQ-binding-like beta-propeller repeat protein n=1 Tax=Halogeometricum borinquense TaxID=60847 RepID=A0A6C0UJI2_9EURY|nr:PQQ-binding-like beta-propeller repeat protein [Halogeometricum borinquense]QIB75652.1 PQQ-binding-like beta-propeller repeat protein [Halogeometricum borinquense]